MTCFLCWILSCADVDSTAAEQCVSWWRRGEEEPADCFFITETTKWLLSRYTGANPLWKKVTDNQIIPGFGSIIKQPAEPHGEHKRRKWASCSQVTHTTPQRLGWQLLASCAPITLTSSNSVDHRGTEAANLEAQPVSWVRDLDRPADRGECRSWLKISDHDLVTTELTYSLGLVLTSTLRGSLLLKHCLRRTSTSEKGLRNTRSPFIANSFFPTSRPAVFDKI